MDADDWKEFQAEGKRIRLGRQQRHNNAIIKFANERGLKVKTIQKWQLRISDSNTTIDIFPQQKRYHNLTKDKRGDYHHLNGFLYSIFKDGTASSSAKDSR
jgi:hypothetical protein